MTFLAQLLAALNAAMRVLFEPFHGLISILPSWLSLTVLSALLGVGMLLIFKYTSNQKAIGRVRDHIKARLLGMKLFKDNIPVVLKYQLQVFGYALLLLLYSIPPIIVMALPFLLILGQMGTRYQSAPLAVNEPASVIMQLNLADGAPMPDVALLEQDAVEVVTGPVRVFSKAQVFWKLKAIHPGEQILEFKVGESVVEKAVIVGTGIQRVSMKRPGLNPVDLILYPQEKPFDAESTVQSITVSYPERAGFITGSGNWVISLFLLSLLSAFAVKPIFKVKV
jgi:hypothetical protein